MPKTLNCATCAAPLDAPQSTSVTMGCRYCGSVMILPEELRGAQRRNRIVAADSFGISIDQSEMGSQSEQSEMGSGL